MLHAGEMYLCSDPHCGCEIQVKRGASPGGGGNKSPRCCCGREMTLIGVVP
jgi:hypothetical protein